MNPLIQRFETMLAAGTDNALLRFGLGQAYAAQGRHAEACVHLREALRHDPHYSAAWKLLARSYLEEQCLDEAQETYEKGIQVAEERGDVQAAREMQVYLKRLRKSRASGPG